LATLNNCDDSSLPERISLKLIDWGCGLGNRFGRLKRPGASVTLLIVAAYGIVQVLKGIGVPHDSTWAPGSGWLWVYAILAALATVASLLVVLGYRSLLGGRHERDQLAALARGVVPVVVKNATSLTREDIRVGIWVIQGPKGFRRLERRAIATEVDLETTPIFWTKGKGVMGRCWARRSATFANLEELRTRLSSPRLWCAQPRDRRFRFSWEEFRDTRRYKAVLAVPLRPRVYGRYRLRGVLVIDVLAAGKGEEIDGLEENPELSGIVRTCQAVLGRGSED
jgi:hypothetical protein